MMALYMPMQPSSKTPRMALLCLELNWRESFPGRVRSRQVWSEREATHVAEIVSHMVSLEPLAQSIPEVGRR